jgi:predicted DNA-binding transcriptional regulator YafY
MDSRVRITAYRVPALERGLRLLELFSPGRTEISFAEAARELRVPRASAYRIVKTLELMGYLTLVQGATYSPGPALLRTRLSSADERATGTRLADSPLGDATTWRSADESNRRLQASAADDRPQEEKQIHVPVPPIRKPRIASSQ